MEEVSTKEKDFAQLFQMTEFLFEKHDELQGRVTELAAVNQGYSNMEEDMHQKQMAFAEDLQEKTQRLTFYQQQSSELEALNEQLRVKERDLQSRISEL